ncbi:glycosyltransferase family 2 protein [Algibacter sp. L4_22]|uniref:glycosyltransferase family 2 protein n=1 Tax=Algibacter sp. L4_22 TaxID=2942477 RepID=UPI00201B4833|nr:glycosyltransferase family 2 protein [Algibacter sp. L4_22]MCL5128859.1 glycosyltransferase family 2 protein [Algibacter sp. L4_22]
MKLSIVILNYNVRYFLELALRSAQAAISDIDAEIIVVDNNSSDDSCQMVKRLFPEVKLIENKENFGFSKGNNIGIATAKGEYICVLNPDTVVAEDTFTKLLDFSDKKEKLGIVGCRLMNGSGLFLPESKRNIPTVKVALKKILGNPDKYYANHLHEESQDEVGILVGAFMLIKKNVFDTVGGFDEDYFMYGEDIDLSYKILNSGYKNYYYGGTSIIHFKGESTLKDRNYALRFYGAMQIFYEKHFKQNLIFDLVVWLGIKLAFVFRRIRKNEIKIISEYIFISNEVNSKLEAKLSEKLNLKTQLTSVKTNAEVIFDANVLSYKDIIEHIKNTDKELTYKILPNQSNFIIGSNDGLSQGKVIVFQ